MEEGPCVKSAEIKKIEGKKTYITLSLGMIVAIIGRFWGPLHLGPIDVPQISSSDMWKLIWEGFVFGFLRNGVSKK